MNEHDIIETISQTIPTYMTEISGDYLFSENIADDFAGRRINEHLVVRECIDGDIGSDYEDDYSWLFIIEDTNTHNLYAYDDCYIGSNAIPIIDLADMNIYEKGIADSTPAEHEYIPANSDDIFGYSSIDKRSVLMLPLIYRGMEHLQDAGIIK